MTLKQLIQKKCELFQNNVLFKVLEDNNECEVTYGSFLNCIKEIAGVLLEKRENGKLICIWGKNSYEWIVIFCAAIFAGYTVIPLDNGLRQKDVEEFLYGLNCKIVLFDEEQEEYKFDSKILAYNFKEILYNEKVNDIMYSKLNNIKIQEEDPVLIICTSGTTDVGKKVVLSHKNIVTNICDVGERIELIGKGLLILPLSHMYSLTAALFLPMYYGREIILSRHVRYWLKEISQFLPDFIFLVPALAEKLYQYIEKNHVIKNKLKKKPMTIYCGGAPLSEAIVDKFNMLQLTILNGYGMTECSPVISTNTLKESRKGSVGKVLANVEVKIMGINADGIGRLFVKGPSVMLGYLNKDFGISFPSNSGWFNTGDLARIDNEGYLYIEGREKNIILLKNGYNVYPEELENKLSQYDEIEEVIVEQVDNAIVAHIYPRHLNNKLGIAHRIDEILQEVNTTLPIFKRIQSVDIVEVAFDKSHIGKIRRVGK